jgi:hypothetical protein
MPALTVATICTSSVRTRHGPRISAHFPPRIFAPRSEATTEFQKLDVYLGAHNDDLVRGRAKVIVRLEYDDL